MMSTQKHSPDVYFPLEITSREYAGALLLAVELAARGVSSVVGHKSRVRRAMDAAPRPGVLFYKGGDDGGWRSTSGHVHVGSDPEAGITYPAFSDFFERRKALWDLSTTAAQFCYGAADHEFLQQQFPDLAHRFHRVGTPRVQAWGADGAALYRQAMREIRRRYGRFVLLVGSGGTLHEKYREPSGAAAEVDSWRSTGRRDSSANERLVQVAGRVSTELGVTVVIRPHPIESWDAWLNIVRERPGVFVEGAFDLSAWTRCAEVTVHSGRSTAAFEAAVAGRPSIGLSPSADQRWVPEVLSHGAPDLDTAVGLVERAMRGDLPLLPSDEAAVLLDQRIDRPAVRPTAGIAEVLDGFIDVDAGSVWHRRAVRELRGRRRPGWVRSERLGVAPPFKRWPLTTARIRRDVDEVADSWGMERRPDVRSLGPNCALIGP